MELNVQTKIRIMSDLHLEFGGFAPAYVNADVLVLAGDIFTHVHDFSWITRYFNDTPVVFVPGNHEYYRQNFQANLVQLKKMAPPNVYVLDRDEVVIRGIRFLGATLWTDFNLLGNKVLSMLMAEQSMSDYQLITYGASNSRIRATDFAEQHAQTRQWLAGRLAQPFEGKTVVVTHHAPSELSIPDEFKGSVLNAAYASRLDDLFGAGVDVWIHGHTHTSLDYELYGTRVICNPRGYYPHSLNKEFREDFILRMRGGRQSATIPEIIDNVNA